MSLTTLLKRILEEDPATGEEMIRGGLKSAKEGNAAWAKLIWDRVDGTEPETMRHEFPDSDAELDAEIARLEGREAPKAAPKGKSSSDA